MKRNNHIKRLVKFLSEVNVIVFTRYKAFSGSWYFSTSIGLIRYSHHAPAKNSKKEKAVVDIRPSYQENQIRNLIEGVRK